MQKEEERRIKEDEDETSRKLDFIKTKREKGIEEERKSIEKTD